MIREPFPIEKMKEILKKYNKDNIKISPHYIKYLEIGKREISKEEVADFLLKKEFYFVEKQNNDWIRYKVVYEISNKYDMVIVVKQDIEENTKILKVVSSYKTNKKLKQKWQKMSKSFMMK